MSYAEWGYDIYTIDEGFIKEVAEKEYMELDELIDGNWFLLAQSRTANEDAPDACYMSELIDSLETEDSADEVYEKIMDTFQLLQEKVEKSTGMVVDLFASIADLRNCDIDYDDYFFVAKNLYIVNPEISKEAKEKIHRRNVVEGG